jgi:hypothetical protein
LQRGRKPKPPKLILVEGTRNATRHGSEEDLRDRIEVADIAFGPLTKPENFTRKKGKIWLQFNADASAAWDRYIVPCWWLDASKEPAAIAYCLLWADLMRWGPSLSSSKHTQMRAYAAELGLTDERNRGTYDPGKQNEDDLFD